MDDAHLRLARQGGRRVGAPPHFHVLLANTAVVLVWALPRAHFGVESSRAVQQLPPARIHVVVGQAEAGGVRFSFFAPGPDPFVSMETYGEQKDTYRYCARGPLHI